MKDKSSLKILLAEDSKITRQMEVKVLNELGYKNIEFNFWKLLTKHSQMVAFYLP